MKTIKLYLTIILAFGVYTACSNEDVIEVENNKLKQSAKFLSPQLDYDGHIKQCSKFGPTMVLNFSWDAGSNLSHTIYVDVTDLNGNYIGTWSKSLSNTFDDFSMTIGYPPSGLKDCSLLLAKTKYKFHVWEYTGIPATPSQWFPDFIEKTAFCFCTK